MILQNSSRSLVGTTAMTNGGGSPAGTYTTAAFELSKAEADEPLSLKVVTGAITGTTPGATVELQTCQVGESTATATWVTAQTTPKVGSSSSYYQPVNIPVGAKFRFKITAGNADNAGNVTPELYSRTKPNADSTP